MSELKEFHQFIENWSTTSQEMKHGFLQLFQSLSDLPGIQFDFVERPGVSYSLRPNHVNQKDRNLFAMIDVIDDNPEERWLSVCFYEDMITDPDEMGDLIPEGLAGDDGYCFDIYDYDESDINYLVHRLKEAYQKASE